MEVCGCEKDGDDPLLRKHWKNGFKTAYTCKRCARVWGGEPDLDHVPPIEGIRALSPELAKRLEKQGDV